MKSINNKIFRTFTYFACSILFFTFNQFVFSENVPWSVRVINKTKYTVEINKVQSYALSRDWGGSNTWEWDLGPYASGVDRTDLLQGGTSLSPVNYVIGIEEQTGGRVVIIDANGVRSDQDKSNQGFLKMSQDNLDSSISINFDNKLFEVHVHGELIPEGAVHIEEGYVWETNPVSYPFFTITITGEAVDECDSEFGCII